MEKLDRLGWASGLSFISYGVRIGVRVTDAAVLGQLLDSLPPDWRLSNSPFVHLLYSLVVGRACSGSTVRYFNLLYAGSVRVVRTMAFDEILQSLESISRFHVALYAPRRVFVHAGVVGWHDKAIVIPGMSFTGKSCLVDALVRAGATYYSDEFAVFDDRGYVHPYAKPITLRGKQDHSPSSRAVFSSDMRCT